MKSINGIVRIPPVVPIVVRDPSSYDQIRAGFGILLTDASHDFAAEAGTREYMFHLANGSVGPNEAIAATNIAANAGLAP